MATNLFNLTGKIALVTGASRGIGESIAKLLAEQGAHVIVSSRKLDDCQLVADAIISDGGSAEAMACHVGNMDDISNCFAHIKQAHGKLNLNVVMVGDLRYGRTVHSLSHALSRFGANLTFIAPPALSMPDEIIEDLKASGANITVSEDLVSNLPSADVIYMTRIQKERFPDEDEYLKVAGIYKLSRKDLKDVKESMIIMHPLPRVDEIHPNVDNTPHAAYFDQAFNGVVARMALLCFLFGVDISKEVGK